MDDTNMQSQVPLLWIKDCLQRVPRILECLAAMQATSSQREIIQVTGLSNQEFLARYAGPGRLGLSGGITLIDKAICRAQRHLSDDEEWGWWSHAFVFQGERPDGHQWVIESDLQLHHKHIQFGAQENRVSKYYDEKLYSSLAVLDFGLSPTQCAALVKEGLELIANRTRYSVRELVGTLIALRHSDLRSKNNLLARQSSMYCSALVRHLFREAGLDLAPGVDLKNTTPEHLARTDLPHVAYVLRREEKSKLAEVRARLRGRMSKSVASVKALKR
jgi:hypothetical protein